MAAEFPAAKFLKVDVDANEVCGYLGAKGT